MRRLSWACQVVFACREGKYELGPYALARGDEMDVKIRRDYLKNA
jgi:hypothetical protein